MWRSTGKSPGVREDRRPGQQEDLQDHSRRDFFAAYPFSKTLGASVSLFSSNQIGENHATSRHGSARPRTLTGARSADRTASSRRCRQAVGLDTPYISRFSLTDSPRATYKFDGSLRSTGGRLPSQTLSTTLGYSTYTSVNADRRIQYAAGTARTGARLSPTATSLSRRRLAKRGAVEPRHVRRDDDHGSRHGGPDPERRPQLPFRRGAWTLTASAAFRFRRAVFRTPERHLSGLDINLPSTLAGGMNFDASTTPSPADHGQEPGGRRGRHHPACAVGAEHRPPGDVGFFPSLEPIAHVLRGPPARVGFHSLAAALTFKTGVRQESKEDIKSGIGSGHQWKYVGTGRSRPHRCATRTTRPPGLWPAGAAVVRPLQVLRLLQGEPDAVQ